MANAEAIDPGGTVGKSKSGKKGLLFGLLAAVLAAGGGFYAVHSGLLFGGSEEVSLAEGESQGSEEAVPLEDIAFVPIEPIVVSIDAGSGAQYLRFRGELEVRPSEQANVEKLLPRIVDVLNGYLRAVEPSTLKETDILPRLRSQMLRRIRLVVGENRVEDLLVMEFILK